ncbi:MAG: VOC family protein [Chloroflexia bacterium]|nr:VOC family protein [Chloroflexia bacterium]
MKIPAIHHVQLAIPRGDEPEARRYYGELLGLKEVPKPENLQRQGGVWFSTGSLDLHLGVDPSFGPATKAHVAFEVADLQLIRDRIEAAGFEIVEDEPLPGHDRFYTVDPFGNRLEFLSPFPK